MTEINYDAYRLGPTEREKKLLKALVRIGIGGNHLASVLIGRLGARFSEDYPPSASLEDHESVRAAMSCLEDYDIWVCWSEIMLARGVIEE